MFFLNLQSEMRNLIYFFLICFFSIKGVAQNLPIFLRDSTSNWADSIFNKMTEEERIAQLFMVIAYSNKSNDHVKKITTLVKDNKIGGLMFLQGGPVRQATLTNYYQSISKYPLMIAMDAEWGVSMRLDSALRFPWQMTLGAIDDNKMIYQMGAEIARQCSVLGVHINFAPVVDINSNPLNPIINNRSFGEDRNKVTEMSIAYMQGMQDNNILACAKHFPGHGDTEQDSHKTLPIVNNSRSYLDSIDLYPFNKLINSSLGAVMVAHLQVPSLDSSKNTPTSLSKKVVSDLLKKDMNFRGLVFTDGLNMKGVTKFYKPGFLDVQALIAGNDILLCSEDVPMAINQIKMAISRGDITQKEIDERCYKILRAKEWMKLDEYKKINTKEVSNLITTENTKSINNSLVKKSITLLQNYEDLLPLKRLDTLKIASLIIGDKGLEFKKMLSNYAPIDYFHINKNIKTSDQISLLNKLLKYNLVIISLHQSNKNAWTSYEISENVDILLQSIALQNKTVLVNFSNPYSLNSLLFTNNFDAILLAYQNSDIAQNKTAQAIFGGISVNGSLPVSTKHFMFNHAIKTSKIRLAYVLPGEINFSSNDLYKIDSIVENAIKNEATPGCQILVAKNGNVFFHKSYGYHTYDKKIKVKNNDVYDLASITKIIATLPILMKMVDDKILNIDHKIGNYLDLDRSNKEDLVIKDILAHQSGLQSWIPFYKETLVKDSISGLVKLKDSLYSKVRSDSFTNKVAENLYLHSCYNDTIRNKIINSELLQEKKYNYSDLGYYLFHKVIEDVYNDSINLILKRDFYSKLGLEKLGYYPLRKLNKDRIVPTELDISFRGQLLKGYVHDMGAAMLGGVGGHAGLFSNANDLAKIMQMYLQEGEYGNEKYLSKKVIEQFTKCHFCVNDNRRGLGFDKPALEDQEGGPTCKDCVSLNSFGHSGFTGTLAWVDPDSEIVYIFLSNRIHPDASNKKLLDMNVRTEIMQVIFDINDEK